jgi:hypothetical protein
MPTPVVFVRRTRLHAFTRQRVEHVRRSALAQDGKGSAQTTQTVLFMAWASQ